MSPVTFTCLDAAAARLAPLAIRMLIRCGQWRRDQPVDAWQNRLAGGKALFAFVLLTVSLPGNHATGQASAAPSQRVLVLYSDERLLPANVILDDSIRSTLEAGVKGRIEFHSEFLDAARFPGGAQEKHQADFFRNKYRDRRPDLLIAVSGGALSFLVKYGAELFSEVPIVYCSVAGDPKVENFDDDRIASVPVVRGEGPTLELALRLHPDTRQVAVVAGNSARDLQFVEAFREVIPEFERRVTFSWLTNLSIQDLRDALARLPDHSIVLYLTMFQDAAGRNFLPRVALEQFALQCRPPIYGCYDTYLGHGIVGGSMVPIDEIGRKAAQLGLRILAGEDPQTAARSDAHQFVPIFDWRQLHRWKIDEKLLPPGSVVRNRVPTAWEQHRGVILLAGGLCVLEACLIAFLLLQRRRRMRVETFLNDSEQRMKLAVEAAGFGIWVRDLVRNEIWASDEWRSIFGFARTERLDLSNILQRVHPDDRERLRQKLERAQQQGGIYEAEYRVVLPDGEVRWIGSRGRVDFNEAGSPILVRGVSMDFTERKKVEHELNERRGELAHLSRVNVLGEVAGSIAHELNQPLAAMLSNSQVGRSILDAGPTDLKEISAIFDDIVTDAKRAGGIIHGMRAMIKKEKAGDPQPLLLNEAVEQSVALLHSEILARKARVDLRLGDGLPLVLASKVELQQVLINLLLNSLDALQSSVDPSIEVITEREDGHVIATVRDYGPGIRAELLEQLFEPFVSTKPNGLGLGLAISRRIMEQFGGELRAENHPAGGAMFRLIFPVTAD